MHESYHAGAGRAAGELPDLYARAFRSSSAAMAITRGRDELYVDVNDAFVATTGFTREQVIGRPEAEVRLWAEPTQRDALVAEILRCGAVRDAECRFTRAGGGARTGLVSAELTEIDGEPALVSSLVDVTDARRGEEVLRRSEAKFARAFRNSVAAMTITDLDSGRYLDVNDAWARIFGVAPQDAIGKTSLELGVWKNGQDREGFVRTLLQHGLVRDLQFEFRRAGGQEWRGLVSAQVDEIDGRVVVLSSVAEVTESERAREELARSNRKISEILESIQDDFFVLGSDWNFRFANRQFASKLGMTPAELVGANVWQLFSRHLGTVLETNLRAAMEQRETRRFETPGRYTDAWYRLTAFPSAEGITVFGTEVTEQKRAEAALRESEESYRSLFHSIDEGFCTIEVLFEGDRPVDYRFLEVNPAFEKQTGLTNAAGRRIRELVPDHEAHWFETYGRVALTGESVRFENEAAALGRYYDVNAFRVGSAERRRVAVLFNDIGERKRHEQDLRRVNADLAQADRRKSEFLAVLSHELRNPLAPIRNSVYVLQQAATGGEQAARARAVIERQVQHLARLVDDLLEVTRITQGKVRLRREFLELGELARRCAEDHRALFSARGIAFEVETPGDVFVKGDPSRLAQVIGNLLANAAKFTPAGGCATLRVEAADGQARLRVRDSGAGIAPDLLDRLFEPFVQADRTLERTQGGLGLGLAILKGLVELHGGSVTARSEGPEQGAEFVVTLPSASGPSERLREPTPRQAQTRRRVLVIEDSPDAAESVKDVLELHGHEVELARDGLQGLELARRTRPDVVLCDIGLPGMNGFDVGRALRADVDLSGTKLIALSGYAQPEDVKRSQAAGFDDHWGKPVDPERLADL